MRTVSILSLTRLTPQERARIEAVDPAVRVTEAAGFFDGEFRDTWPAFTADRFVAPGSTGTGTRAERDAMLAAADVALIGWPYPLDLRARGKGLKWVHQRPAGASNLQRGDLWGCDLPVTTSRGEANGLAIAEFAVAGIMHLAKGLQQVALDRAAGRFDMRAYRPMLLDGKAACVVGAGGIGLEVGRLLAGLGMRVTGTRRSAVMGALPPGFSEIAGSDDLDRLLPGADVVAVCCHWTPETDKLFDSARFALMKPGAIIANVARGEIIEEDALAAALAGGRLRGAALDVYVGEFERGPMPALWADPRVVVTPHVSGATDDDRHGAIGIFCDNLRAWLDGGAMRNVIDWGRGY